MTTRVGARGSGWHYDCHGFRDLMVLRLQVLKLTLSRARAKKNNNNNNNNKSWFYLLSLILYTIASGYELLFLLKRLLHHFCHRNIRVQRLYNNHRQDARR